MRYYTFKCVKVTLPLSHHSHSKVTVDVGYFTLIPWSHDDLNRVETGRRRTGLQLTASGQWIPAVLLANRAKGANRFQLLVQQTVSRHRMWRHNKFRVDRCTECFGGQPSNQSRWTTAQFTSLVKKMLHFHISSDILNWTRWLQM